MPTKHPRIAVTRDDALDRALRQTKSILGPGETSSASAQVRALALRGARSLGAGDGIAELWARLEREHGIRPPRTGRLELGEAAGEVDPTDPTPATDALEWARGER